MLLNGSRLMTAVSYSWILFYILTFHISLAKFPLYIGGTYPASNVYLRPRMAELKASANLAMRDINLRNDILKNYELRLSLKDDKFDKVVAGKVFVDQILYGPQLIALLGPWSSSSSSIVAPIARYWNLIQISTGATSTQFSNRNEYPYFYTSLITDITYNLMRVSIVKYFRWQRVAILHLTNVLFDNGAQNLQMELEKQGIKVIAKESFISDPELQVKMLKEKGARIIFLFGFPRFLAKIFCYAYKLGMYGENHAWLASNFLRPNWWATTASLTNCTADQILQAGKGYLAFGQSSASTSKSQPQTVSGLTYQDYLKEYDNFTNGGKRTETHSALPYDAIWCLALALNQTEQQLQKYNTSLVDFNYNDTTTLNLLNDAMLKISFTGLTGPFSFLSGSRMGDANVMQFRGNISMFGLVKVGFYKSNTKQLTFNETDPLIWPGNHVPLDGFETEYLDRHIALAIFVAMSVISVIGILIALVFLAINFRHRKLRIIKMSSPRINNLILLGFILCLIDVIIFGIDHGIANKDYLPAICKVRVWLLSLGFTLSFGAMFAKTWRVHVIFTNKTKTKVVIKDTSLFGITGILLVIDLIILVTWMSVDPFAIRYILFPSYPSSPGSNIIIQPRALICYCGHMSIWLGVIYGYKFLVLLFGTFLAWETRGVSIPELNDSRHIGLAIYNAVIFAIIGVLVGQLTETGVDGGYIIISIFILVCTISSMCLFFIPKIQLVKNANLSVFSIRPIGQEPRNSSIANIKMPMSEIPISRMY